jgi:hypothetical protein
VRVVIKFAITLTAVAIFLSAAAIVILAILVAAIRSDDRAKNLTRAPRTRTFTLLTNWSFSPFREASEAARTVASRSRRSR